MITEQTTFTWKHLHEGSVVVPQQHPLLAAKTTEATKNRSSTPASAAVSTASASQPIARTAPARSANGTRASFAWQPPRPERPEVTAAIVAVNDSVRALARRTGAGLIDLAAHTSSDGGRTWRDPSMHVGDRLHYTTPVRAWIADQLVAYMLARR